MKATKPIQPATAKAGKQVPVYQHQPVRIDKHGLFKHGQKAYRVPKAAGGDGYSLKSCMRTRKPVELTDGTGNTYDFEEL